MGIIIEEQPWHWGGSRRDHCQREGGWLRPAREEHCEEISYWRGTHEKNVHQLPGLHQVEGVSGSHLKWREPQAKDLCFYAGQLLAPSKIGVLYTRSPDLPLVAGDGGDNLLADDGGDDLPLVAGDGGNDLPLVAGDGGDDLPLVAGDGGDDLLLDGGDDLLLAGDGGELLMLQLL